MSIKKQLMIDEGIKLEAYYDTQHIKTIGVGHNMESLPKYKGQVIPDKISEQFAMELLDWDIQRTTTFLEIAWPHFKTIPEGPRKNALINMAFQLGLGGLLRFKKMITAIEQGDFETASKEGLNSKWAKQTPKRAKRVMEQLRTNKDVNND